MSNRNYTSASAHLGANSQKSVAEQYFETHYKEYPSEGELQESRNNFFFEGVKWAYKKLTET